MLLAIVLQPLSLFAVCSCVGNAMATPSAQQQHQDYFRSVSSESTTYMMVPAGGPSGTRRRDAPSKMWVAMVVILVVVLQVASTTGLFLYLNMSISQVRAELHSIFKGRTLWPSVCLFWKNNNNNKNFSTSAEL